jgi:LacI family transcriptional regulator
LFSALGGGPAGADLLLRLCVVLQQEVVEPRGSVSAGELAANARFQDAMRDAGLQVRPEWVVSGAFSFRSGVGAGERLLSLPDRPTAIFASNDDMALGVMAAANRLGLTLPAQLSVAGFDDSPIAQAVWPQLTTIRQPVEAMARAAATMLVERTSAPAGRLLDFELVVRGSTGPAPP